MRCTFKLLFSLLAALLALPGGRVAGVSNNHSVTNASATQSASMSPARLAFGSQYIAMSRPPQTITTVSGVAMADANAGDFAETNSCLSSLAVNKACQISVTFTPAATGTSTASVVQTAAGGGSHTVSLSGEGTRKSLTPAFYVATNGNDSNPGSRAAPFATLGKCQRAMRASNTVKTCYIRAGTYTPAAIAANASNCLNGAGTDSVTLTSADNGETWSYYPPDGYNTAIIDGQSTTGSSGTKGGNGTGCAFGGYGVSNITIVGLQFRRYLYSAFWVNNRGETGLVFKQNIVHDLTAAAWGAGAVAVTCSPGVLVRNNYFYNLAYTATELETSKNCSGGGGLSNAVVSSNVIINSCTWPAVRGYGNDQNGGDCGAIYFQDVVSPSSTGVSVKNNYVRDVNLSSNGAGNNGSDGHNGCCAIAVYLDDGMSNVTVTGNVFAGIKSACVQIHGGDNNVIRRNICDMGNAGYLAIAVYQRSNISHAMTGNVFSNNIVVAGRASAGDGFTGYDTPVHPMTIDNNVYFNYVGSSITSTGTGGVGSDSHPVYKNPQISCWAPHIRSSGRAFSSSASSPTRSWGPPGFVIPQSGTAPSWPHAC